MRRDIITITLGAIGLCQGLFVCCLLFGPSQLTPSFIESMASETLPMLGYLQPILIDQITPSSQFLLFTVQCFGTISLPIAVHLYALFWVGTETSFWRPSRYPGNKQRDILTEPEKSSSGAAYDRLWRNSARVMFQHTMYGRSAVESPRATRRRLSRGPSLPDPAPAAPSGTAAFILATAKLERSTQSIQDTSDRRDLTETIQLMREIVEVGSSRVPRISTDQPLRAYDLKDLLMRDAVIQSAVQSAQETLAYEFTRLINSVQVVVDDYLKNQKYSGLTNTAKRQRANREAFQRLNAYAKNHMEQLLESKHDAATLERKALLPKPASRSVLDLAS